MPGPKIRKIHSVLKVHRVSLISWKLAVELIF